MLWILLTHDDNPTLASENLTFTAHGLDRGPNFHKYPKKGWARVYT